MKTTLLFYFTLLVMLFASISTKAQQVIPLWDGKPPFTRKHIPHDKLGKGGRITKVSVPELTVYFPEKTVANQMGILICPGGGYGILAIQHEGHEVARWYSERGYVAAVLKYRLPDAELLHQVWEVPLADAKQGIRIIRKHAKEWGIDSGKIGVLGFSAGGHLAASISVHGENAKGNQLSSRPDFSILIYPVISMDTTITHQGSRKNLLGEKLGSAWEDYYSTEKQVNASTPPAFLVHSWDDKGVVPDNSIRYAKALKSMGTKVELHLFEKGGHGYGMGNKEAHGNAAMWPTLSDEWIKGVF